MREKPTGRPRGFGFVVFSDPSVLDRVLQDRHTIDGRTSNGWEAPSDGAKEWVLCGSALSTEER
ncbi:hypothetical protein CMV_023025, partial [Castanea mollissima]